MQLPDQDDGGFGVVGMTVCLCVTEMALGMVMQLPDQDGATSVSVCDRDGLGHGHAVA